MTILEQYLEKTSGIDNSGYHSWLLENGQLYGAEIKVDTSIMDIRIKQCFRNSQLGFFVQGLDYVQGFYTAHGLDLPLEHAWNAIGNSVIDLTTTKFDIDVDSRFGIQVPAEYMKEYLTTNMRMTALRSYYVNKIK